MNITEFNNCVDLYSKEANDLLIKYKTLFQLEMEKERKIKKSLLVSKKKEKLYSIECKVQLIKNKLANLDILNRFINGESFTLRQLYILTVDNELLTNRELGKIINKIESKIALISELALDDNQVESKLEEYIYIEELFNDKEHIKKFH